MLKEQTQSPSSLLKERLGKIIKGHEMALMKLSLHVMNSKVHRFHKISNYKRKRPRKQIATEGGLSIRKARISESRNQVEKAMSTARTLRSLIL